MARCLYTDIWGNSDLIIIILIRSRARDWGDMTLKIFDNDSEKPAANLSVLHDLTLQVIHLPNRP